MEERIERQFEAAGWRPGRAVNGARDCAALDAEKFEVWDDLLKFFNEFAGLTIWDDGAEWAVWIDGEKASQEFYLNWTVAYSRAIGQALAPIGGYSHMTIYMARDGGYWGAFDEEYGYLGESIFEVVDGVLNSAGDRTLDLRLDPE